MKWTNKNSFKHNAQTKLNTIPIFKNINKYIYMQDIRHAQIQKEKKIF